MRPHAYGIDISDRSIEIVGFRVRKGRPVLLVASRADVPPGAIERGHIVDAAAVVRSLSFALDAAVGPKRGKISAGIALPSSIVYSKTFTMPSSLDEMMLKNAAAIESQDCFPVSASDSVNDIVIGKPVAPGGPRPVLYFAVARGDVRAYRDVLSKAGIDPLWFDVEEFSVARGVGAGSPGAPVLVVDIGSRVTTMLITSPEGPRLGSSVPYGGDQLTAAIEKKLALSLSQAETLKRAAGVNDEVEEGRVLLALQRPLEEIVDEIEKTARYAQERFGIAIRGMVLCGGTSLLPGIVEYIRESFPGIIIERGDPFKGVDVEVGVDRRTSVLYASAVGLALRAAGVRGSPGIDLSASKERSKEGVGASIRRLFTAITSGMSMVSKRPRAKKKSAKEVSEETPAAPPSFEVPAAPVAPTPAPVAAPVLDFTPPEMIAKPAPAPAPAPTPAPASIAPAAYERPQEEEADYGSGIGDILAQPERVAPLQAASTSSGAADESKLSISSILRRPDEVEEVEDSRGSFDAPVQRRSSWVTYVLMLVLLAVFAAAAAGVYMYVSKNGLPVFGGNKAPATGVDPVVEEPVTNPTAAPESVNVSMFLVTDTAAVAEGTLLARAVETDVSASDVFAATGEAEVSGGKASGQVKIVNTTSSPYAFVATTRLLSEGGVLFRMTKAASIPPNGEVIVDVAADQPGASGDIGPSNFTIPGLSAGLQTQITGVSDSAMTGGGGKAKAVSQEDIDAAKASLEEKLKAEALENIKAMLAEGEVLSPELVTPRELSVTAPEAGTVTSSFTLSVTHRFRVLLVPEKDIVPLLQKALVGALPPGLIAEEYSLGTPAYAVLAFDTAAEKAEMRAEATVMKGEPPLGD